MILPAIQELLVSSKPLGEQKGQRGSILWAWHCGQQTSSLHFTSKCWQEGTERLCPGKYCHSTGCSHRPQEQWFWCISALAVLLGAHIYIGCGVVHLISSGENTDWPLLLRTAPVGWPQVRPTQMASIMASWPVGSCSYFWKNRMLG